MIRLLKMRTELLEGKGINTYREKNRSLLLDIRNGKYSYEEIFEMVDEYEKNLNMHLTIQIYLICLIIKK